MNKFEKIYNEYIEKPVLKFDDKEIDLCIKRDDFLYLLKYGKKLEQVLDKIKEYIWSTKYEWGDLEEDNEDFDIDPQKILELLEEIE